MIQSHLPQEDGHMVTEISVTVLIQWPCKWE